ncbi:MAG: SDR family oxidoreductase [SAR202 cluster bacterium]|nr:SDR family oxidoreductase [SAR202 cluster bacterium]
MTEAKSPTSLITGGAGFLGSHLCEKLLSVGHSVICMDNLITGTDDNIRHLVGNPKFTLVHHDVTHPINLGDLLRAAGHPNPDVRVDYLLHFASPASPKDYARHPIHTLKVGALGTYYALGLARAHKSRFLLASSSEVYGDPEVNPQPESYYGHVNPVGSRSVYDEAKRFAEAISSAYLHTHNLDVRIARLFNTYGPRMRVNDGRAVPAFMTQAIRNEPVTVYGDGSQTRSLTYVDDTVEGLYRLLMVDRKPNDELICNIGNPEEVTILEVAQEIIALTGSSSKIVFSPLPKDDPLVRRPDLTRTRKLLGWEPRVPRKEGLAKVVPYFMEKVGKVPA